ncbi:Predicted amidohydrolase [Halogranum rubrum]|uniref:Predicted amidohydrolase n=1 Tax=Halogranum rubrum TaxID=553466 RepID=A0A1I4ETH4_9EURY|nr:carbon-nitrogen hydrolase family protein [Halogranum rubrum]SFL08609.1 Predicted amidohydrolase [Halogranum rubrum]
MATVAVPQCAVDDLDVEANLTELADRTARLDATVDVALFPEYALTGFVADERVESVALTRDGPELDTVRETARTNDVALLVGFVEREGSDYYNATAYVEPNGETTVYRKRHLWGGERSVLTPGSERVVVETPIGRTGILTCYDLNFVAESAALTRERVDALFVTGAWPATHSENWRLLLRARALDGVRWVVGAGRTGARRVPGTVPLDYAGRSAVVRPDGTVAAATNRDERTLVAELDPDVLAEQRAFIPVYEEPVDTDIK